MLASFWECCWFPCSLQFELKFHFYYEQSQSLRQMFAVWFLTYLIIIHLGWMDFLERSICLILQLFQLILIIRFYLHYRLPITLCPFPMLLSFSLGMLSFYPIKLSPDLLQHPSNLPISRVLSLASVFNSNCQVVDSFAVYLIAVVFTWNSCMSQNFNYFYNIENSPYLD